MNFVFTRCGAVLAAVILLLTACGGGGGGSDVSAASVTPVTPTAPAPDPVPVPASVPAAVPGPAPAPVPVEPPVPSQLIGTVTLVAGSLAELTDRTIQSDVDGPGPTARFNSPGGLAVDRNGIVYVADTRNHTIRKIWTDNMVTTFAGGARVAGASDGFNNSFSHPAGMSIDGAGNLYVTDGWSAEPLNANYLWWTRVRRISPLGEVATPLMVGNPQAILGPGIAADSSGNFYLTTGGVIRKFNPAGVPNNITAPEVYRSNSSIAVDKAGAVYFGHENTVRKIVPGQAEVVLAGSATPGYAEGAGTAARFNFHQPTASFGIIPVHTSIVVDSTGNLYLSDTNNFVIRRITPEGIVSTIAVQRFASPPRGMALAGDKTLYVTSGNAVLRIDLR